MKKILISAISIFVAFNINIANASELTKSDVENIVKEYITNNPEIIGKSLADYQIKLENKRKASIFSESENGLYNGKSPVFGNKDGDVRLVEFFDYNCGYCRKSFKNVNDLVAVDKNVKVIFKEFPILSAESVTAAKWALAAHKQDRYVEFHTALMNYNGRINVRALEEVAESLGMNVKRLKQDSVSKEVEDEINRNRAVARELKISGTPAFVVENEVISGAIALSDLKNVVISKRKK